MAPGLAMKLQQIDVAGVNQFKAAGRRRQFLIPGQDSGCQKAGEKDLLVHSPARPHPGRGRRQYVVGIIAQADIATHMNELEKTGEAVKDLSE